MFWPCFINFRTLKPSSLILILGKELSSHCYLVFQKITWVSPHLVFWISLMTVVIKNSLRSFSWIKIHWDFLPSSDHQQDLSTRDVLSCSSVNHFNPNLDLKWKLDTKIHKTNDWTGLLITRYWKISLLLVQVEQLVRLHKKITATNPY